MPWTSTPFDRGLFAPMSRPWLLAATGYVVLEAVLGAVAFSTEDGRPLVEWIAFLLLAPAVIVTFPVMYVVGAAGWSIRDSMPGEPMWPVALVFSALFLAAAIVNVLVIWVAVNALRRRNAHLARQTPGG
jgi:biotin transporter BioY